MKHKLTQELDEMACTCGLRWAVDEENPHRDARALSRTPGEWPPPPPEPEPTRDTTHYEVGFILEGISYRLEIQTADVIDREVLMLSLPKIAVPHEEIAHNLALRLGGRQTLRSTGAEGVTVTTYRGRV